MNISLESFLTDIFREPRRTIFFENYLLERKAPSKNTCD
jgi:hypothetical protein